MITNWGGGDYQLRSAQAAKHIWVAVITRWGILVSPPRWRMSYSVPKVSSSKHFFSLNVQIVSNDRYIYDVDCGWPGSTHDARVWRASNARVHLELDRSRFLIAADSAYPTSLKVMKHWNQWNSCDTNGAMETPHHGNASPRKCLKKKRKPLKNRFFLRRFRNFCKKNGNPSKPSFWGVSSFFWGVS